jgi:raffinose/stachyose/melibiose transport system permease protein
LQERRRDAKALLRLGGKLLILLFLVMEIYPVVWIVLSSFKMRAEFTTNPTYSMPKSFYVQNYIDAMGTGNMISYIKNSVFTVFPSVFIMAILSTMASFALSKMQWKLRESVYGIFLSGILIPVQVILIPLMFIYKQLHLLNNHWSLIFTYTVVALPLSILLLTNFFRGLPDDILEAAVIDGCNLYTMFGRIVLPLTKNAIVTVITIQFCANWNDLIFSMTFISRPALATIQTGLRSFILQYGQVNWGPLFAAVVISILPTLLLYTLLNKLIIEGMTAGAVKG